MAKIFQVIIMIKTFNVTGMHCDSCGMLIKESLEEIKGINTVDISYKTGKASVDFDEHSVDAVTIKRIIKDEGYEVEE